MQESDQFSKSMGVGGCILSHAPCAAVVFLDHQLTPGALPRGPGWQGDQDTSPAGCIWTYEVKKDLSKGRSFKLATPPKSN